MRPGPASAPTYVAAARHAWSTAADAARRAIAERGFAWIRGLTEAGAADVVRALGDPLHETVVSVDPRAGTYVCQPGAVPLHTDHPVADVIAWRCERQDPTGGASLLVDGLDVVAALDAAGRRALAAVSLGCPPLRGLVATESWPLLWRRGGDWRVFFAPWLVRTQPDAEREHALATFRAVLAARAEACLSLRLEAGDVLLADNGRMLHGRGPLAPDSARRLRRTWIAVPR